MRLQLVTAAIGGGNGQQRWMMRRQLAGHGNGGVYKETETVGMLQKWMMVLFCALDLWTGWDKQEKNACGPYGW